MSVLSSSPRQSAKSSERYPKTARGYIQTQLHVETRFGAVALCLTWVPCQDQCTMPFVGERQHGVCAVSSRGGISGNASSCRCTPSTPVQVRAKQRPRSWKDLLISPSPCTRHIAPPVRSWATKPRFVRLAPSIYGLRASLRDAHNSDGSFTACTCNRCACTRFWTNRSSPPFCDEYEHSLLTNRKLACE